MKQIKLSKKELFFSFYLVSKRNKGLSERKVLSVQMIFTNGNFLKAFHRWPSAFRFSRILKEIKQTFRLLRFLYSLGQSKNKNFKTTKTLWKK